MWSDVALSDLMADCELPEELPDDNVDIDFDVGAGGASLSPEHEAEDEAEGALEEDLDTLAHAEKILLAAEIMPSAKRPPKKVKGKKGEGRCCDPDCDVVLTPNPENDLQRREA